MIYQGDALTILRTLPEESVQMCLCSPPYWGLRDYGTATWEGGAEKCDHRSPSMRESRNEDRATLGGGIMATNSYQLRFAAEQGVCGKCGARRVDQQLGLERTPEEYVGRLVEVFREVRRVLRRDGVLFLNLGDSYATGAGKASSPGGGAQGERFLESGPSGYRGSHDVSPKHAQVPNGKNPDAMIPTYQPNRMPLPGLKPKDLIGVPWKVAFALQQPYYTGKIRDERDRIWLAAMIEAEGCMFIHRRPEGMANGQGYTRKADSFGAGLEVSSTDRVIAERCHEITGLGSICEQSPDQNARRKQTIYRWNLRSNVCRDVVRELYPHMIAKQHEARLLLGCPSSGPQATEAWRSLKALHQGGHATIDFPPPESLFEPGWFLRSDVIWAKKNCMPESVTDRPTKAHEYIFLLSKAPKYFFDQEAVRERFSETDGAISRRNHYERLEATEGIRRIERDEPDTRPQRGVCGGFDSSGRNIRTVWTIATQPFPEAHFATFPEELAQRCIKAGTSEKGCCKECGTPWEREVEKARTFESGSGRAGNLPSGKNGPNLQGGGETVDIRRGPTLNVQTTGWRPGCAHGGEPTACVVLDPFAGSGTTGVVAMALQRSFIGIELNGKYVEMAERRIRDSAPLLAALAESDGDDDQLEMTL